MQSIPAVPSEIARSVRSVFGSNNFYLRVGDQLETILGGIRMASLMVAEPHIVADIPVLAIVTFFQYAESLSDEQAADALRTRLEWKYALHLPVIAPVVPESAFCRYRQEMLVDPVALRALEALGSRLAHYGHRQPHGEEALRMLGSNCSLNRLLWLYGAMDGALEMLARLQPGWLGEVARPYWYTLYRAVAPRARSWANKEVTDAMSLTIGADMHYLLERIRSAGDLEVANRAEITVLQELWEEQFAWSEAGEIVLRQYCRSCSAEAIPPPGWN